MSYKEVLESISRLPEKERLVCILILLGFRPSEIMRLKKGDLGSHTVTIRRGCTKNGQQKECPLPHDVHEALQTQADNLADDDYIFGPDAKTPGDWRKITLKLRHAGFRQLTYAPYALRNIAVTGCTLDSKEYLRGWENK